MIFKIKLEDKAAFLNRMEKQGESISSEQIKDNKLDDTFEVTIEDPKQLEIAQAILNQSPKINTIKEMEKKKKSLTKNELKEMVRQELQATLSEMKDKDEKKVTISLNEYSGDPSLFKLGKWAAEEFPALFKAFADASTVSNAEGQQFVDFGNVIVGLATAGTITVATSLAVMKDQLVDAAKKVKNAAKSLFSGKVAEAEGSVDPELESAIKGLSKDTLAKLVK